MSTDEEDAPVLAEHELYALAKALQDVLPPKTVFGLFIARAGQAGTMSCVSNGDREELFRVMGEFLATSKERTATKLE